MNKFSCSLSGTWVVTVCQGTHWVNYAFYFTKVATLKALNHPAKTRTQGKCQNDYNKKKKANFVDCLGLPRYPLTGRVN